MAVQQNRKTSSKRDMRRAHEDLRHGVLLAKHLALESRLLDVSWCRGDAEFFEGSPKCW